MRVINLSSGAFNPCGSSHQRTYNPWTFRDEVGSISYRANPRQRTQILNQWAALIPIHWAIDLCWSQTRTTIIWLLHPINAVNPANLGSDTVQIFRRPATPIPGTFLINVITDKVQFQCLNFLHRILFLQFFWRHGTRSADQILNFQFRENIQLFPSATCGP